MDERMTVQEPIVLPVNESSQVAEARRLARDMAARAGLTEEQGGRAALIATEAATNLIKHGGGGEMILRLHEAPPMRSLDLIAVDRGRGMANMDECLRDGYSTIGTAGNGLGAIKRQSSRFDAYTRVGQGTVVFSRISSGPAPPGPRAAELLVDGLSLRVHGEEVCGDAWAAHLRPGGATILVVDGLGHGRTANEAAVEALVAFDQNGDNSPSAILDSVHRALLKTRGAAVAVANVDAARGRVLYGGVGNISAAIVNDENLHHLVSVHGTAGHQIRRLQEFTYDWNGGSTLVMYSDGVSSHIKYDNYPGLLLRHPVVVAAVLLRDWARTRDDATVVVARHER